MTKDNIHGQDSDSIVITKRDFRPTTSRYRHIALMLKRVERQMQLKPDQKTRTTSRGDYENDRKLTLQQDIEKLEKELTREENVHRALEQALSQPLGSLPCLPSYDLPPMTLELLSEVAVLEEDVIRLEEQVVQYNQDLYQEAIYTSFYKKNLENSSDFQEISHTKDPKSNTTTLSPPQIEWFSNPIANKHQSPDHNIESGKTLSKRPLIDILSAEKCLDFRRVQYKGISGDDCPNKISESTLKCLMFVFTRMSSNSALKLTEMLPSLASACEHPWAMDFKDPYGMFYEFENTDIGPYKYFYEVEATTISKSRMTISSFLAQRLKILLGKLEVVNLTNLTHQEKLAFWINIYNSCMMNAFLEHGIPETRDTFIQLMHDAKLNIGGHLLTAFTIEHFILRIPCHTKHTLAKDFNNDEVTAINLFGLELCDPLATFALSCGSWSSPAVRVYTRCEVENELEVAKRDYIQAAVGISTTKKLLAIPKLLDWYMLDFGNDIESFVEWVCLQLPSEVQKVAINCIERKTSDQSLSNCIRVIPYEFHFRYLLCK
ncbi:uncharacterized protein [Rutidosis leptorrhynchoides]|uniref:uncharacterized protein n=1 Tax=Rutidosis leptorrhynchoides TaxID=125765 RepID=UPI003A999C47